MCKQNELRYDLNSKYLLLTLFSMRHSSLLFRMKCNTETAQSNTLLINNITFNMVNNSRNALCILCYNTETAENKSTRGTYDKQSNELLFIWFGVCVCLTRSVFVRLAETLLFATQRKMRINEGRTTKRSRRNGENM